MSMVTEPAIDASVVMPAYQSAATIARALRSIARQTLKPREVIVVDDGSSDGTLDAARAVRAELAGIKLRLFRQDNLGAGAARNRAIAAARGEWLTFLDADDEWLPDKLNRSFDVLKTSGCAMVAHDIIEITAAGERRIDCRSRWLANPDDPLRTLYMRGYISSSTVVVRRATVLDVGGFNPGLRSAQDYDLWLSLLGRVGSSFILFGDALLRYYLFEGGITSRVDERHRCNLVVLRDHVADLQRVPGPVFGPVMMRTAIIALEAFRGHRARRSRAGMARSIVRLPADLACSLAAIITARPPRPNFLAEFNPGEELS